MTFLLKSVFIWICFILIAILNGGLREYVLNDVFTPQWALSVSGVSLSVCIFLLTWMLLPRIKNLSGSMCYRIGLFWGFLTVVFEFLFGTISGVGLTELLTSYNPLTGNLWLLVLLVTLLSPVMVFRLRDGVRTTNRT